MASQVSCTKPALPPLVNKSCRRNRKNTTASAGLVYNPRAISDGHDVEPLRIYVQHGRRKYEVTLNPDSVGAREEMSMRHLAETMRGITGVKPEEQTFLYKGVAWESSKQNISHFSPLLRDLGVKNGDKILLLSWPPPVSDHNSVEALKKLESEMKVHERTKQNLIRQMEVIDHIFGPGGSRLETLVNLRNRCLRLKERYMVHIQNANSLSFDHRNAYSQACRRELIDVCQRQMDKCQTAASHLFDRMALSRSMTSQLNIRRCHVRKVLM